MPSLAKDTFNYVLDHFQALFFIRNRLSLPRDSGLCEAQAISPLEKKILRVNFLASGLKRALPTEQLSMAAVERQESNRTSGRYLAARHSKAENHNWLPNSQQETPRPCPPRGSRECNTPANRWVMSNHSNK